LAIQSHHRYLAMGMGVLGVRVLCLLLTHTWTSIPTPNQEAPLVNLTKCQVKKASKSHVWDDPISPVCWARS